MTIMLSSLITNLLPTNITSFIFRAKSITSVSQSLQMFSHITFYSVENEYPWQKSHAVTYTKMMLLVDSLSIPPWTKTTAQNPIPSIKHLNSLDWTHQWTHTELIIIPLYYTRLYKCNHKPWIQLGGHESSQPIAGHAFALTFRLLAGPSADHPSRLTVSFISLKSKEGPRQGRLKHGFTWIGRKQSAKSMTTTSLIINTTTNNGSFATGESNKNKWSRSATTL